MSQGTRGEDRVEFDEFMSESDTTLWVGERDPRLRSTIVSVWLLDRMPEESAFDEMMAASVEAIPRLRQRVVRDALGIAPPRWENDPNFDPRFHVRRFHLGGAGSLRDLLDQAEPIAMQAFDKDRPLWEFYLVGGLEGGRAGVIMKLHHAVSDGVGLMKMTASMVDKERDGAHRAPAGWPSRVDRVPARSAGELLRDAIEHRIARGRQRTRRFAKGATELTSQLLRQPGDTLLQARDVMESVGRLLAPVAEPMSPLMRERGMALSLGVLTVSVEDMKRAARSMGGSLNDVFVTAVAGGLYDYHQHLGARVSELNMMMPINVRAEGSAGNKAGNQFAPSRFLVPVGIEDPQQRFDAIKQRIRAQRAEAALPFLEDITGAINALPVALTSRVLEGMTTATDFVTSNVPGPRRHTYTAGAKIEHMFPFGPPAGAGVNITLFSYAGTCHVGINADRAAVTEPALLLECTRKSFDELTSPAR